LSDGLHIDKGFASKEQGMSVGQYNYRRKIEHIVVYRVTNK